MRLRLSGLTNVFSIEVLPETNAGLTYFQTQAKKAREEGDEATALLYEAEVAKNNATIAAAGASRWMVLAREVWEKVQIGSITKEVAEQVYNAAANAEAEAKIASDAAAAAKVKANTASLKAATTTSSAAIAGNSRASTQPLNSTSFVQWRYPPYSNPLLALRLRRFGGAAFDAFS